MRHIGIAMAMLGLITLVPPGSVGAQTAKEGERLEAFAERAMGIYLTHGRRRHALERVQVKGTSVQINVWRPIGEDQDVQLKTDAVKWLVFGRTQFVDGARAIFSEYSRVKEIQVRFIDIVKPRRVKAGAPKERSKIYLLLSLTRKRFERINGDAIRGCIGRGDCSKVFRSNFSSARFDRAYTKKMRAQ